MIISENIISQNLLLAVAQYAHKLPGFFGGLISNSAFVTILVAILLIILAQYLLKNVKSIPNTFQNLVEVIFEAIYTNLEGIVGKKIAPKCFALLATIFIFFLVSNWAGLLPGVGTIGWSDDAHSAGKGILTAVQVPLLRPPGADLNNNFAIATLFMIIWLVITLREVGLKGFIEHTFAPKGKMKGFMFLFMALIFFAVGILEVISIGLRPLSLSLRMYGNIFAGENLLHVMSTLGEMFGFGKFASFILKVLVPIPFYFLELLVGFLQAVVFALLCAVYIQLSTAHDEAH